MRKKIAAVVLAAMLACASFTGCTSSSPASSSAPSSSKPASSSASNSSSASSSATSNSTSSSESPSSSSSPFESTAKKLRIDNYTYYTVKDSVNYYHVFYCFTVTNTNQYKDFNLIGLNLTVKNAEGIVLDSDRTFIPPIAAGDTITFGGEILVSGGIPTSLSYNTSYPSYYMTNPSLTKQSDLKVFNTARVNSSLWPSFTGEITNTSSKDLTFVDVRVYYRKDGKLLAGENTYISRLNAGETVSFNIMASTEIADYDSFVIIATQS